MTNLNSQSITKREPMDFYFDLLSQAGVITTLCELLTDRDGGPSSSVLLQVTIVYALLPAVDVDEDTG